jgi:hypothetical protein
MRDARAQASADATRKTWCQLLVPADRIIQVNEKEAGPLLGIGYTRVNFRSLCVVSRMRPSDLRLAQENEPKRLLTHREPVHHPVRLQVNGSTSDQLFQNCNRLARTIFC